LNFKKGGYTKKISLGKIFDVLEKAFYEGIDIGFKTCAKSRLNVTTISDCPIKDEAQGEEAYKELCENYSSNKSLYTDGFSDGYKECQKEHEWHYEGTPDTTHKTCIVYVDYLPNIMLCFWNGEVWIETRTLGRFKKVKAWKYVDFPQELNNGKERT